MSAGEIVSTFIGFLGLLGRRAVALGGTMIGPVQAVAVRPDDGAASGS